MTTSYIKLIQQPVSELIQVEDPSSKSISNRLLLLKETYNPNLKIDKLSKANDTLLLKKLLTEIDINTTQRREVKQIDAENSGTCLRFLCAYLCFQKGKWLLTGSARMKNRPIDDLVSMMQSCGAKILYKEKYGYPPLEITGTDCQIPSTTLSINAEKSSQFVTAFLLVLPLFKKDVVLQVNNMQSSVSYIHMTIALMKRLGICIFMKEQTISYIHTQPLQKERRIQVEPDWSAAAFWFVFAAMHPSPQIFIKNLRKSKLQSDANIENIMKSFGVGVSYSSYGASLYKYVDKKITNFTFDCSNNLDLVPLLTVLCAVLNIKANLKGIYNLIYKESNRIIALAEELKKVSNVKFTKNFFKIIPNGNNKLFTPHFLTYDDHRMAMSLSLWVLKFPTIYIENPDCVKKSYPNFWNNVKKTGIEIQS